MEILLLIAGVVVGVLLGFFIAKSKQSALASKIEEKDKALTEKDNQLIAGRTETETERAKVISLSNELSASKTNYQNVEQIHGR